MRVGCCRQAASNCGLAAHAPRSGSKDCFGETPKPTREAHVLPGVWGNAVPVAMIVNPFSVGRLVAEAAEGCRFGNQGSAISPSPPNMVVEQAPPTPNCIDLPCGPILAIIFTTTRRLGRARLFNASSIARALRL